MTYVLAIRYAISWIFLALRFYLSKSDKDFWGWCFQEFSYKKSSGAQLTFLLANALSRRSFEDLEKCYFYFSPEISKKVPKALVEKANQFLMTGKVD
ncbi:hypothetical protein [Solimonas terrae]|uniref:Uncharacterized protein n=1 Tax=Solimonas terrae TaxID=1396819 RepID=A0A6M2BQF1_9GAMM|nr:hypothetical protein [Solimonas terrae]NGY04309.1 hypothetical protein [Solimonas terrae]